MTRRTGPSDGPGCKTIIRALHDGDHFFVRVSQLAAQDDRLSFEARGVLLYLLSKPDDWWIRPSDLQREGNTGRDRVLRILSELEEQGYLTWSGKKRRTKSDDGTFVWAPPVLYESPYSGKPFMVNPADGKPRRGKPDDGDPASGKAAAYKQKTSQTTEQTNNSHTHNRAAAGVCAISRKRYKAYARAKPNIGDPGAWATTAQRLAGQDDGWDEDVLEWEQEQEQAAAAAVDRESDRVRRKAEEEARQQTLDADRPTPEEIKEILGQAKTKTKRAVA